MTYADKCGQILAIKIKKKKTFSLKKIIILASKHFILTVKRIFFVSFLNFVHVCILKIVPEQTHQRVSREQHRGPHAPQTLQTQTRRSAAQPRWRQRAGMHFTHTYS